MNLNGTTTPSKPPRGLLIDPGSTTYTYYIVYVYIYIILYNIYQTYIKHISTIYQNIWLSCMCILSMYFGDHPGVGQVSGEIRNQWYLTSNLDKFLDIFPLNQSNHRGITSLVMAITGPSLRLGPEGHGTRQDFSGFMQSIRTRGRANFPPKAAPEFIRQTSTN